jgi:plasmid stability protein
MDVIVRGLDEKLHRKFKAEAALRGISLSKALEEAMRTWLRSENNKVAIDENESNNLAYESMKDQLSNKYRSKYAVFCGGKFLGTADSLEEAGALARGSCRPAGKALVAKIGEKRPAGGEWLWSSLELQTA